MATSLSSRAQIATGAAGAKAPKVGSALNRGRAGPPPGRPRLVPGQPGGPCLWGCAAMQLTRRPPCRSQGVARAFTGTSRVAHKVVASARQSAFSGNAASFNAGAKKAARAMRTASRRSAVMTQAKV